MVSRLSNIMHLPYARVGFEPTSKQCNPRNQTALPQEKSAIQTQNVNPLTAVTLGQLGVRIHILINHAKQ